MFRNRFLRSLLLLFITNIVGWLIFSFPVQAQNIDPYVLRYLTDEPVEIQSDRQGGTQTFSVEDLSAGKVLFTDSCLNCHAGGVTIPYPTVSLSLEDLKAATPPRDTIKDLVAYMRHPVSYDGSDTNYWCREIPENWLSDAEIDNLAAFILQSAIKAPGWAKN
ncbi:MAG: photosystem II cytochrome PsbV2 [Arthrospira sp. PLM2.Bin9]|nr:photosystem II cytochrome PsbV2 [Arthrospira sp. PLM2.Bin9]TVU52018.1 MAG: photosystem II cytochrome PsbV2 [Arthrospira sp. PLM2.Bin9]